METPLVTIITPSYQSKNTISDTFNSVMAQTYTNWEWIIVDDCSPDDSFDFIQILIHGDKRIQLIRLEKNGGTAVARNTALKLAKGKYITFLDSDDLIDSNYLEEQVKFIKDNGPLISCGYRRKTPNSCTDFMVPSVCTYKQTLKGNPISCLSTMYDREALGEMYFPEDMRKCEDFVFWLNILKKGYTAKGNPQVLATYMILPNSKSRSKLSLIKYMFRAYHKKQKINFVKSWYYVVCWAFYGKKKYRNVK